MYLSHAPNATGVDLTVKCLLTAEMVHNGGENTTHKHTSD